MRRLYYVSFVVVFVVVGDKLLHFIPNRLGQNAVVGFLSGRIRTWLDFTSPQLIKLLSFAWELGVPLVVALGICLTFRGIINAGLRDKSK